MTNVFEDQKKFMTACDQTVDVTNGDQLALYLELIAEECGELSTALKAQDKIETLDALIDIMVVTTGALHSLGVDPEGAWNEVMKTNFAKIDAETGKVNKRDDGKVLKPTNWTPPDLKKHILGT